ncbi:hypothetical protein MBLNU459_g3950t1 [Dothideomycetes sp. NU459]
MGILSNFLRPYAQDEKAANAAGQLPQPPVVALDSQAANTVATPAESTSSTPPPKPATTASRAGIDRSNPRHRAVRQLTLYFAGCTFFTLSVLVTRRAVLRKLAVPRPALFTPSNARPKDANGAVEAAEALGLATINVTSLAIMLTGGTMFALDIADMDDLRTKFKHRMGFDQSDSNDLNADKEVEEWVKNILDNKQGDNKGIAEGLTALVGVLASREEEKLKRVAEENGQKE